MNAKLANNIKDKVRRLQIKLYLSTKECKQRRYHALYDKIYRTDILERAWQNVRANSGSAGIDKESIQKIEEIGVEKVLLEIAEQLKTGKYQALPVRRVDIPKDNGKTRPLGIPVVRDRIVQAAVKIVIEPVFEADFKESSYGFRPKRNAHEAIETIRKTCNNKGMWVIDADIEGYFNNINHHKLMILIRQRISDRRILKIIMKWLKAGIMQAGEIVESKLGSQQGGVISPLLSNIYLNYMDVVWEKYYSKIGKLVRYADDFVVVCKNYKDVQHAYKAVQMIMSRLELKLSKEKTRIVSMWQGKQGFDFLGYHHRMIKHKTDKGQEYYQLLQWLSDKSKKKIKGKVKEYLGRNTLYEELRDKIQGMNRKIVGWRNYYGISRWDKLAQLDRYITNRFVMWINQKRQQRKRKEFSKLYCRLKEHGLAKLAI